MCLTDSSVYLDEILKDRENCRMYSTADIDALPDMVYGLLANPSGLQHIIDKGYNLAESAHTWEHRAALLNEMYFKD